MTGSFMLPRTSLTTAYVGVGSNVGDRAFYLREAFRMLTAAGGIDGMRSSPVYENEPVGEAGPGMFYNCVWEIETDIPPHDLLGRLREIERRLKRSDVRKGPRTIDLDVLLYGSAIVEDIDLIVPHPRMMERAFVLQPLCDLTPDIVHPIIGRTIEQLRNELPGGAVTMRRIDLNLGVGPARVI
ncbi:MAG TPA: 2-amino-4-hydroxy-6-hydroxymethyldihydropteridine diphosphokinase [candidate division Zixibacteria bacterium]|jgi:2-amino-4-hydroxy-6-hydroxymethyldihydropteridine diphosphokinase